MFSAHARCTISNVDLGMLRDNVHLLLLAFSRSATRGSKAVPSTKSPNPRTVLNVSGDRQELTPGRCAPEAGEHKGREWRVGVKLLNRGDGLPESHGTAEVGGRHSGMLSNGRDAPGWAQPSRDGVAPGAAPWPWLRDVRGAGDRPGIPQSLVGGTPLGIGSRESALIRVAHGGTGSPVLNCLRIGRLRYAIVRRHESGQGGMLNGFPPFLALTSTNEDVEMGGSPG